MKGIAVMKAVTRVVVVNGLYPLCVFVVACTQGLLMSTTVRIDLRCLSTTPAAIPVLVHCSALVTAKRGIAECVQ